MASPRANGKGAPRAPHAVRRHDVLAAGILTGTAGGIGMLVVTVLGELLQDLPPPYVLRAIGESFVGREAIGSDGARAAFGLLVHLATSAALGVVVGSPGTELEFAL